jgi:hypothetical protein
VTHPVCDCPTEYKGRTAHRMNCAAGIAYDIAMFGDVFNIVNGNESHVRATVPVNGQTRHDVVLPRP